MKHWLREYGVVAGLIIAGVAGYLFYDANRQDILAYSLDTLETRLLSMVDTPESQAFIAERFGRFKEQVLNQEVAPEQVEDVTASILNLSHRGVRLTPEEAELMLDVAVAPEPVMLPEPGEAPAQAARPPVPPPPVPHAELEALGKRLRVLIEFDEAMAKTGKPEMARHVQFHAGRTLMVRVDSSVSAVLALQEFAPVVRTLRELEKQHLVVWRKDLAREVEADRAQARRELQAMSAFVAEHPPEAAAVLQGLAPLASLKHLEAQGMQVRLDEEKLERLVKQQVEQALALQQTLEAEGAEAHEAALEAYLGRLEQWVEAAAAGIEAEVEASARAAEAEARSSAVVQVKPAPKPTH